MAFACINNYYFNLLTFDLTIDLLLKDLGLKLSNGNAKRYGKSAILNVTYGAANRGPSTTHGKRPTSNDVLNASSAFSMSARLFVACVARGAVSARAL